MAVRRNKTRRNYLNQSIQYFIRLQFSGRFARLDLIDSSFRIDQHETAKDGIIALGHGDQFSVFYEQRASQSLVANARQQQIKED